MTPTTAAVSADSPPLRRVACCKRSTQGAKEILTTVKVVPLLEQVAVPMVFDYLKDGAFAAPKIVEDSADVMITELGRWAAALKPLRG